MQIVAKMPGLAFTIELQAQGDLISLGRKLARIEGAKIVATNGKTILSLRADQTVEIDQDSPMKLGARGAIETSEGVKVTLTDDGVFHVLEPSGTPMRDVEAKVSAFKPAMRRTAILVFIAFFGVRASTR
jgi:hypothetical protein